jgi:amino acid transporter
LRLYGGRLWSFPVALITAELATSMPDPSGFLLWSRRAFGPFVSFIDAWIMIVVVIIDQSLYPLIFVSYIKTLSTLPPSSLAHIFPALSSCAYLLPRAGQSSWRGGKRT